MPALHITKKNMLSRKNITRNYCKHENTEKNKILIIQTKKTKRGRIPSQTYRRSSWSDDGQREHPTR